jgi:predicted RNase H-like HicB family nuclease
MRSRITHCETEKSSGKSSVRNEFYPVSDQVRVESDGVRAVRQVVIYPGEDGYWVAECPSLPGCTSQGENKERAIANIKEAIGGYIAALEEDGLPVSEEHFDTLLVAV